MTQREDATVGSRNRSFYSIETITDNWQPSQCDTPAIKTNGDAPRTTRFFSFLLSDYSNQAHGLIKENSQHSMGATVAAVHPISASLKSRSHLPTAATALSAVQVLRPGFWQRGTQGHESEWCSPIHFILLLRLTTNLTEGWT